MMIVNAGRHHTPVFRQQLRQLRNRTRLRSLLDGLTRFGALGGLMVLAAVWSVGGETGPGAFNGWGLSLSLAAGLAALIWHLVLRPWRVLATLRQMALRVETEADFANLVVAAEEAGRRPDRWPTTTPVPAELKRRLIARATQVLALVTPADALPLRYVRSARIGLAVTMALGLLLLIGAPEEMARGWFRLWHPVPRAVAAATGGLFATGLPDDLVAGQEARLVGLDFASGHGPTVAEVRVGAGIWQPLPTRRVALTSTPLGLPDPYRQWEAALPEAREDFAWRLRRGERVSDVRRVEVRHYPLLTTFAARLVPPVYTGLPERDFERLPSWIEVPINSRLELTAQVNHAVQEASLATAAGDTLPLAVDSLSVRGALTVATDQRFSVALRDHYGLVNRSPLVYEVVAAPDQSPAVSLERPDDDGILPISGEVTLLAEAADDYGLARLRLLTRTGAAVPRQAAAGEPWRGDVFWDRRRGAETGETWQEIGTAAGILRLRVTRLEASPDRLRGRYRLELRADDLDLVAGDRLDLVVEAEDNKRPRPAGRARSAPVRLMVPAAAEVLVSQAEANEDRKSELEEMRRRSQQLNLDLDRLTRELMKNPVPDWARQQEMEAAIDRQQKLQQELARVADQLKSELEKLAQSQLTNEAQVRKADEMSELLGQNNSEQLSELLQKMQDGGGQASPEDVARAMDEVARNQEDMARRLDAALSMLKRMAQEQELAGLTALLEQMIQKQQELADLSRQLAEQQQIENQQNPDQLAQAQPSETDAEQEAGDEETTADGESDAREGAAESDDSAAEPEDTRSPDGDASDRSGESAESANEAESNEAADPQPTAEELARRQEALEKELAQLQEKLEEALENLRRENAENPRESNEAMAQALEQALEQVQKQQQEDAMGKASEQLQQMDPGQAAKMQEQTLRDLGSLYSVLLKSQQAMQAAMQMEQVTSLRGLAADMLALSARQEEIAQKIPPQLRDLRSLDLTRNQHRLQKAAAGVRAGLSELMAEAPNRIMKLLGELDGLIETMGESVQAMEDSRSPVARRHARASLAQTNRLVIGLLTEAQMQGGGGGGGGSPQQSLSEQLQQMAQEQAGLNGVTEELRRMLADRGISQKARSQMQRLGQQQADMAARMGELAEEERQQPEGERLLGDLAEMGRDMERISREIDDGLVSDETLVRQERILSRMLDARNSVRRRDYTNRRESETAGDLYSDQTGTLGQDSNQTKNPFRLKYQPLEQAPMEYRDLVRRYFAALDSLGRTLELPDVPAEQGDMP